MADGNGYRVATPDGGAGRRAAATCWPPRWLDQLRAATAGGEVLALPYADPDLTALRARRPRAPTSPGPASPGPPIAAAGCSAADVGDRRGLAGRRLPRPRDPRGARPRRRDPWSWTAGRCRRPSTSATRRPAGPSCPTRPAAARRPGRRPRAGRPARPGPTGTGNPVLAAQRFVAETAMITAELPEHRHRRGPSSSMPPRRWDPAPEFLDQLVTLATGAVGGAGAACAALAAEPAAGRRARPGCATPGPQRARELPEPYLRGAGQAARPASTTSPASSPTRPRSCPGWRPRCCGWSRPGGAAATQPVDRLEREQDHLVTCAAGSGCSRAASPSAAGPAGSR